MHLQTNFIPRVTNSSFVKVPADNTADSSLLILNPDESYAFSFIFTSYDGSVETALGHPTVTWCTSMGEYSVFHGDDTVLKTNSNDGRNSKKDGLTIECMKYPTSVLVGDEFEVIIRISNHTTLTASVRLHCNIPSIDMENSSNETNSNEDYGLCVLGVTHTNIGAVDPGEFEDVTLRVYAMNPGLQSLVGLSAIDLSLRREYKANSLCKVLVRNESE